MFCADRHMRIKGVVLENHRDIALFRRSVVDDAVADADFTTGDIFQPRDHAQESRFAAPRRADEDNKLTVLDGNIYAVDDLGLPKALRTSRIATDAIHIPPNGSPAALRTNRRLFSFHCRPAVYAATLTAPGSLAQPLIVLSYHSSGFNSP